MTDSISDLKKIIVFGGSGFIGSRIAQYLRMENTYELATYSSSDCNLLDSKQTARILGSCNEGTSVIFCSVIPRRIEESWNSMLKNISMIHNFTSGLSGKSLRSIIFMSSVDVYGMPPETLPIRENAKLKLNRYYELSKLISERLLCFELTCKCAVTILRLPGIYGVGDKFRSVIGSFSRKVIDRVNIEIYGEGSVKRDFLEVSDLCKIVMNFLLKPSTDIVNVATGISISIKDLISTIADVSGIRPKVKNLPAKNIQEDLVFDISKLKALYPDVKFTNLKRGIKDYIKYVKSYNYK